MRLQNILSFALATNVVVGSSWFSKAAYNKWHETELERWLSDHDIPYPTPADRKNLEHTVSMNWDAYAVSPYKSWDTDKLTSYLKQKGVETKQGAESSKDYLVSQVASSWGETEDKADAAWSNVKDWILDTWTDSQLKAFADKHGVPVPQPRNRDTLLQKVRSNYETIAKKAGEYTAYPGDWLYETWSESDLKEWLDTHGFPAPQPDNRDKLVAAVRRNSRIAYLKAQDQANSASASANAAYASLSDKVIDAWSESQLKEFADKNGISVPQGSKVNELRALVRKHKASLLDDTVSGSAASAFGAATSNVNDQYAKATDGASLVAEEAFNEAVNTWTESRLKAYLDARGVPVPHGSKTDELRALVRRNSHKAASVWSAWSWDDLSLENLKKYIVDSGDAAASKVADSTEATRDDLVNAAQSAYASASTAGGDTYASATSYLSQVTAGAKSSTFDTWSESELKAYLDGYGIAVPQGSKLNELKAYARKQHTYFKYGTTGPVDTAYTKIGSAVKDGYQWVVDQLSTGAEAAKKATKNTKEEL